MARVDEDHLKQKDIGRYGIHGTVNATYFFFDYNGERFFQIDTYGSSDREMQGVPSQKIQFDKETAKLIIEILQKGFNM
jgi:hypothetical protein